MEHLGAVFDQRQHLFVADPPKPGSIGKQPGIPVVDPVHIGEDLASVGFQVCRQSNGGGVRTPSAQCGDIPIRIQMKFSRPEYWSG